MHVDEPDTFVARTNVIKHSEHETNVIREKKDKQLDSIECKDPEAYHDKMKKNTEIFCYYVV